MDSRSLTFFPVLMWVAPAVNDVFVYIVSNGRFLSIIASKYGIKCKKQKEERNWRLIVIVTLAVFRENA